MQRTLQGFVFDEYGWEPLENAADKLNPDGKATLRFFGKFPFMVITNGVHAIVCDPDKVIAEYELQLGKAYSLNSLEYYDGDLCVLLSSEAGVTGQILLGFESEKEIGGQLSL